LRFAAGIIFFEDRDGLARLLESIHLGFDYMFCLDGKFPNRPGKTDLSADGSREVVKSYSNAILLDAPWPEPQKRAEYLRLCAKYGCDYLVILDTDEYAQNADRASWQAFREEAYRVVQLQYAGRHHVFSIYIQVAARAYDNQVRHGDVWMKEGDVEYSHYPRLWYQPYNLEYYKGAHYYYRMKDPTHLYHKVPQVPSLEIIKSVKFRHDHELRTAEHQDARQQYQKWLVPYEAKLIHRWDATHKPV